MATAVTQLISVLESLAGSTTIGPMFTIAVATVGASAVLGLFFRRG